MGGNDTSFVEAIEKEMAGKDELIRFVPWYIGKSRVMHMLEQHGYIVDDSRGPLHIQSAAEAAVK